MSGPRDLDERASQMAAAKRVGVQGGGATYIWSYTLFSLPKGSFISTSICSLQFKDSIESMHARFRWGFK